MLSIEQVGPPADVAERLHLDPDTKSALRRENVFWADDDPVYLVTTYLPWTIAEGTGLLEAEVPHPYGIHGVLEDRGYAMARLDDYATARMPSLAERTKLGLESGVPLLDLTHVSVRADGAPYELTRFVMRGVMSSLRYNVPVE